MQKKIQIPASQSSTDFSMENALSSYIQDARKKIHGYTEVKGHRLKQTTHTSICILFLWYKCHSFPVILTTCNGHYGNGYWTKLRHVQCFMAHKETEHGL